jgi:N-acetylglutamate synthase
MIRTIEELSLNAWPSLQTLMFDGWVIRFSNGYTRRANSINPIYNSSHDVEDKIRICERMYRSENLPVVFKMTAEVNPQNLDAILEKCGYRIESRTSVQTMELIDIHSNQEIECNNVFTEDWLTGFCSLNSIREEIKPIIRQMFGNTVPKKCFATIHLKDRGVAYGLGVLQNEYIGFFDIVTDMSLRNQGFGRRLMSGLLTWGKQNQAQMAYLQVMLNNAPALHLYSRLGFKEAYQYWYRVKR